MMLRILHVVDVATPLFFSPILLLLFTRAKNKRHVETGVEDSIKRWSSSHDPCIIAQVSQPLTPGRLEPTPRLCFPGQSSWRELLLEEGLPLPLLVDWDEDALCGRLC